MSTTHRPAPTTRPTAQPAYRAVSADQPTATFPTGQWLAGQAAFEHEHEHVQVEQGPRERLAGPGPFAGWRDATPTELLPGVPGAASGFPRVSTRRKPTSGRVASRTAPTGTKGLRRHLRAALAGILIAAALLTGLQLYAAAGISSARQAALAARTPQATEQAAPAPAAQPDVRSDIQPDWVTEATGAAYDRTDPASSPLDLPRCTTSPDTPLPCLATISPSQTRAVVLEEDASLTALVRR